MSDHQVLDTCPLCQKAYKPQSLARHLEYCILKNAPAGKTEDHSLVIVLSEGYLCWPPFTFASPYRLFLMVPSSMTLDHLDTFLRYTWLECCHHLSEFNLGKETVANSNRLKYFDKGTRLNYTYDFGSSTFLEVRIQGTYPFVRKKRDPIQILARNAEPKHLCKTCGKDQATVICTDCICPYFYYLCESCAPEHPCDEERFLPYLNSPRTGVCGYTGN